MNKNSEILNSFSKHLFWDVNITDVDIDKNSKFVISKVLQYGLFSDWKIIAKYYGVNKIATIATSIRELDKKTSSFLSVISGIPKTKFKCYSTKQSVTQHWSF